MADDADKAQSLQEREVAAAISPLVHRRDGEGPEYIDGKACCRDCGEPIPEKRLAAIPGVSRCVLCQQAAEQGE